MVSVIDNIFEMIRLFTDVAFGGIPTSPLLLVVGSLFVAIPVLVFGYVAIGGIVDLIMPDTAGRPPHQH